CDFLFSRFYSSGSRDSILIKCNLLLIKLIGQLIISSRRTHLSIIDNLINYLNRNESDEMIIQVCNEFIKIIEFFVPFNWPFANSIIDRFTSISDFKLKQNITDVIYIMLKKTKMKNQELIGLKKGQIETSIDMLFSLYFSNDPNETKLGSDVISNTLKLKVIRPFIEHSIRNNGSVNQQNQLLKLANNIDNHELITSISTSILLTASNSSELMTNMKSISNTLANYKYYKKSIIIKSLKKLTYKNMAFFKDYINFVIIHQDTLNKDNIGKVIDKLEPLFAKGDVELKKYIVDILYSLKKYPKYKRTKVKKMFNSYKFEEFEYNKKMKNILKEMN
ncbi:MAG: hypothetical protein KAT66_10945, partial [Candidatus Lokiarchaeota archaeon]|nr:hypothetical protein [Candidatus Lokiarchaeota archaeon]